MLVCYLFTICFRFLINLLYKFFFFFLNDTAPTEISPLPLHAALPISLAPDVIPTVRLPSSHSSSTSSSLSIRCASAPWARATSTRRFEFDEFFEPITRTRSHSPARSEEHTSELQSPCNLVCRLLLEKK